jgi:hypothetical protein
MIFNWFDAKEAVDFALEISVDIDRLFPVATPTQKKPSSNKKDQKKLDSLVLRTRTFAQMHRLNVYKKAKLLNTVKWKMRDKGHDEVLINQIIGLLAPLLNR